MFNTREIIVGRLARIGPKYLPFSDVATPEVPLSRLLRLSLFQMTVGMALVLLVGTLNRVMIVELAVPASIVAGMLALPLVFAPFRTLIGFKSDTHVSALGWRRIPYIWKGTLYQFGGFAIMPFALLVLSGYGEAVDAPRWIGYSAAALAFLLVGAGVHMVQTVGLALATDLVREEDQPKVVGLMYVMLLFGMVLSALVFGALLENYTPRPPDSGDPRLRRRDCCAQHGRDVEARSPRPEPCRTAGRAENARIPRSLGAIDRSAGHDASFGDGRPWHAGLRHRRRPVGAVRRPSAGLFSGGDDPPDRTFWRPAP